jgi:beta-glucosidase/6-phospho-beta-glucosidase/beta-galactosidase
MMNERIKELAFEAMSINQKVSDDSFFVEVSKLEEFEKFAELIVRECSQVVNYYHSRNEPVTPQQILRHFGVSE